MRQFFVLNTLSLFVRNVSNLLHLKQVQGSSRHVDSNATDRLLMKRGIVLSLITTLRRICFNTFMFNCLKMFFAPTHTLNPTKSSLIP